GSRKRSSDEPAKVAINSRRASPAGPSTPASPKLREAARNAAATVAALAAPASGGDILVHGGELARLLLGDQCVDEIVEGAALEDLLELMQGQPDAMVGDAALGEIVGADALRAVARADLVLTLRSACAAGPLALKLVEARAQDLHCKPAILMLRLFCRD